MAVAVAVAVIVAVDVRVAVAVEVAVRVAVAVDVAVRVGLAVGVGVPAPTLIATGDDAIPFATTTRVLAPPSIPAGTSNSVDTGVIPVATAIVL